MGSINNTNKPIATPYFSDASGATDEADGTQSVRLKPEANIINTQAQATLPPAPSGALSTTVGDLPMSGGSGGSLPLNPALEAYFGGRNYTSNDAMSVLAACYGQQQLLSGRISSDFDRLQQDAQIRKTEDEFTKVENERKSAVMSMVTQATAVLVGTALGAGGAAMAARGTPGTRNAVIGTAMSSMSGPTSNLVTQMGTAIDTSASFGYKYQADEADLRSKVEDIALMQYKSLSDTMNNSKDDMKRRVQSLFEMQGQINQAKNQTTTSIAQNVAQ